MPDKNYESRKRWNASNYKQINIAVRPELSDAFRAACERDGVSMREALIAFMAKQSETASAPKRRKEKSYTERRNRREAVTSIINQLEMIRDAENQYMENMPENLKNSSRYEAAENTVQVLDDAINLLDEAFS